MWIFLNDSFLSIVAHNKRNDLLLVRARAAGDIERVFPDSRVTFTPRRDYPYRAVIKREEVGDVLAHVAGSIKYPNFKNSVHTEDRHHAYLSVWWTMRRFQKAREENERKR